MKREPTWPRPEELKIETKQDTEVESILIEPDCEAKPNSRAAKKNASHGNEVLPKDTTHLIKDPVLSARGI